MRKKITRRVHEKIQIAYEYTSLDFDKLKAQVEEIKKNNPSGCSFRINLESYHEYGEATAGLFVIFERDESETEKKTRLNEEALRENSERIMYEQLKKKFDKE